jgi:hypothetical protein
MFLVDTNALAESEFFFPIVECFHIVGFAFSIGTIAVVDFSMLGLGIPRGATAKVAKNMAPWTMAGIANMLITGPLLYIANPGQYGNNIAFDYKLWALAIAIIYNYTIHRKVALSGGSSPAVSGVVAVVSLALWLSLVAAGIFIAFAM